MSGKKTSPTIHSVTERRVSLSKAAITLYSVLSMPFYFSPSFWTGTFSGCKPDIFMILEDVLPEHNYVAYLFILLLNAITACPVLLFVLCEKPMVSPLVGGPIATIFLGCSNSLLGLQVLGVLYKALLCYFLVPPHGTDPISAQLAPLCPASVCMDASNLITGLLGLQMLFFLCLAAALAYKLFEILRHETSETQTVTTEVA
jgi:hypothetical protein